MTEIFQISSELTGKFAIIKHWPGINAAEDENIARLKNTAHSLGLECIEVDPEARMVNQPYTKLTQKDVDFVINLHFETPKSYDIFSFVALWNPLQFYHDWGYSRFSRHLLTHDDFLSCSSTWADDHVKRMIAFNPTRDGPLLKLYHSLSHPILKPTLGEKKIFYAGINWEKLGKKKTRHQELLERLDKTGNLKIFGPKIFQGVNVWEGFKSYQYEIPFDGISMIHEINRAGIALVFSSDAHKQSELMSNRLFESLAAGAVIICDENPFAKRNFGNLLLYIDSTLSIDHVFQRVYDYLNWINKNPDQALKMAIQAQERFREFFSLDVCLKQIYQQLPKRKNQLNDLCGFIPSDQIIECCFLLPSINIDDGKQHIESAVSQNLPNVRYQIFIDQYVLSDLNNSDFQALQLLIENSDVQIKIEPIPFYLRDEEGKIKSCRRMGDIVLEIFKMFDSKCWVCIVGPSERLFSNHLRLLAGSLQQDSEALYSYSDMLIKHTHESKVFHDLLEGLDISSDSMVRLFGYGRFLFRLAKLPDSIDCVLPYLNFKPFVLLTLLGRMSPTKRATLINDIQHPFSKEMEPNSIFENEIIRDYAPLKLSSMTSEGLKIPHHLEPTSLSLEQLSEENKYHIASALAKSLPLPRTIKRTIFGIYRRWLRRPNISNKI
ncbi:MAG: glycosyltransferase [Candidatus Competibacteraceae bacterium]